MGGSQEGARTTFLGVVCEEVPLMTMVMAEHGRHHHHRHIHSLTTTTATDRACVSGRRSTVLLYYNRGGLHVRDHGRRLHDDMFVSTDVKQV